MPPNPDTVVTLATAPTEMEAQLFVNILREHGISAVATGGFTSQFRAEAPGVVRVMVRQDDLVAAQSVLAEVGTSDAPLPAEAGESEDAESPEIDTATVHVRLARWGVWGMLAWAWLALAGPLVSWFVAGYLSGGSSFVVITSSAAVVALILILAARRATL
jgi:hypothetical protein